MLLKYRGFFLLFFYLKQIIIKFLIDILCSVMFRSWNDTKFLFYGSRLYYYLLLTTLFIIKFLIGLSVLGLLAVSALRNTDRCDQFQCDQLWAYKIIFQQLLFVSVVVHLFQYHIYDNMMMMILRYISRVDIYPI